MDLTRDLRRETLCKHVSVDSHRQGVVRVQDIKTLRRERGGDPNEIEIFERDYHVN